MKRRKHSQWSCNEKFRNKFKSCSLRISGYALGKISTEAYNLSADGQHQRYQRVDQHRDGDEELATQPLGQLAARDLQHHVAPEERRQDHTLLAEVPVEVLATQIDSLKKNMRREKLLMLAFWPYQM